MHSLGVIFSFPSLPFFSFVHCSLVGLFPSLFSSQLHCGPGWLSPSPRSPQAQAEGRESALLWCQFPPWFGAHSACCEAGEDTWCFIPNIGWSLTFISQPRVISHLSAKQAFLPAGEHWEEEEEELTALLQISPAALPAACSSCDVALMLCSSNPQLDACPVHENESLYGGTPAL